MLNTYIYQQLPLTCFGVCYTIFRETEYVCVCCVFGVCVVCVYCQHTQQAASVV
jgi:hypothetical protein